MKALLTTVKLTTLAFAVTMAFLPATALALPKYDREVTYFDAPVGGSEVGGHIMNCTGHSSSWGVTTPYFSVVETPCDPEPYDQCSNWPAELGKCPL